MIETHLDLTYTIIWSLALANVLGAALCLILARPVASLTRVRFTILAPVIMVLIMFAAYQSTRSVADLVALGAIGAMGILFKQAGWSRPAFLIGFVLAPGAENYFYQAVQFQGTAAFSRPGVILIGALIVAVLFMPMLKRAWRNRRSVASETDETSVGNESSCTNSLGRVDLVIIAGMLLLAGVALVDTWGLSLTGGIMPWLAIGILVLSLLCEVARNLMHPVTWVKQTIAIQLFWIGGFFLLIGSIMALGFVLTATLFSLLFLLLVARVKPWVATGMAMCVAGFLVGMGHILTLSYPTGVFDPLLFQ